MLDQRRLLLVFGGDVPERDDDRGHLGEALLQVKVRAGQLALGVWLLCGAALLANVLMPEAAAGPASVAPAEVAPSVFPAPNASARVEHLPPPTARAPAGNVRTADQSESFVATPPLGAIAAEDLSVAAVRGEADSRATDASDWVGAEERRRAESAP